MFMNSIIAEMHRKSAVRIAFAVLLMVIFDAMAIATADNGCHGLPALRHCFQDVTAVQEHDNNSLHLPDFGFGNFISI